MIRTTNQPDMAQARLRLDRAEWHVTQCLEQVQRYEAARPFRAVPDDDPDETGQYHYRFVVEPPPPVNLALLLGDAIHNARAALDYAVVAMAEQSQGRTLLDEETDHLQFPIHEQPIERFKDTVMAEPAGRRRAGRLWLVSEEFVDRVEQVQPYNGWSYAWPDDLSLSTNMAGDRSLLALLNRLSNQEKHRRLALVVADLRGGYIASDAGADAGLSVLARSGGVHGALAPGTEVALAPTRDHSERLSLNPVLAIDAAWRQEALAVLWFLPAMIAEVSNVLLFLASGEALGAGWR
jgi:hypothetical protein